VKMKDPALAIVIVIGLVIMLVDLWHSLRKPEDWVRTPPSPQRGRLAGRGNPSRTSPSGRKPCSTRDASAHRRILSWVSRFRSRLACEWSCAIDPRSPWRSAGASAPREQFPAPQAMAPRGPRNMPVIGSV